MATLDDLKTVLESIDSSMEEQKVLLTNMISMQQRRDRLSSVDTTVAKPSTGQSIGAAASGIGTGVGTAAAGLGIAGILGLGALALFENFDAEAIKENIVTLLSISDEFGGKAEFFKEGGTFFAVMSGIGIGLAAFGIGEGLVGLGQWITDDEWVKTLKNNVIELLSIADEVGGNLSFLYEGGTIGLALGGLGAGLAVFGVGQAAVGLAQFLTEGNWAQQVKDNVTTLLSIAELPSIKDFTTVNFVGAMSLLAAGIGVFSIGQAAVGLAQFITAGNWAQQIKDNVTTLLSIAELPSIKDFTTVNFVGAMSLLAAGIGVFAVGNAAVGLAQFITAGNWAQQVKDNVTTLLSIAELPGMKDFTTINFAAAMVAISAGLAAFAIGKGANVVVEGAADALDLFTGNKGFAQQIKDEVTTLLSIPSLTASGSADEFVKTMSKLSFGLMAFAGGNLVGTLLNATSAIISFFSGAESPFEQIRLIASDADNLIKAAEAIEKIAAALEKFGGINVNVGDIDFEKLAENLGESIPLLYHLANGGIYDPWGLGNKIDFGPKGILDSSLKLDEMAAAIAKVNYVLGQSTEYPVGTVTPAATPTGGQNATKVAEASYAMVAGRPEVPPVELAPTYAMVAGRPEVPQVAVSEKVVPITITNAKIDITSASILSGMMAEPKTTSPGYAYVAGMPEIAQNKARMDVLESAIKAVAESPEISAKPYAQIMQEERDKANTWLSQAEAIAETNKEQNTNNVNYSPVTDASSKTYVGGTTNTTIITPRSGNDLNYGIPYGVQ